MNKPIDMDAIDREIERLYRITMERSWERFEAVWKPLMSLPYEAIRKEDYSIHTLVGILPYYDRMEESQQRLVEQALERVLQLLLNHNNLPVLVRSDLYYPLELFVAMYPKSDLTARLRPAMDTISLE